MSGRYITNAATRHPHRIKAAAAFYGVGIVIDAEDSPHLFLDQAKAEFYYSFGENDATVPDEVIPVLKNALKKAKLKYFVEQPKGALHGYMFAERTPHHPRLADAGWKRLLDLFDRNLKKRSKKEK